MSDDLAERLDLWMRAQRRWVPSREIEQTFGVPERALRFDGGRAGLLSYTCISSAAGYKHVAVATDAEFRAAQDHDLKPLKSRFYVLRRRRDQRRRELTRPLRLQQATLFGEEAQPATS